MRAFFRVGAFLVILIPVTCAAQSPRLFDVTPAHGVSAGRPLEPGGVFTPGENPIYVWFRHEGCPDGATITSDWYYLGSDTPLHISEGRATVGKGADSGQFNLELAPGKRWPVGEYRVELRVDGVHAADARFRVVEAEPTRAASIYVHPSAGYQFEPPAGWTLDDRVSTADVQLKRADGNALMEITSGPVSARLDPVSYAAGWESQTVGPGRRLAAKRAGRAISLNGEIAYEAVYEGQGVLVKVVFVGFGDRFFVLTGVFAADDFGSGEPIFNEVARSLRRSR
jgi:hypothetical protein